MLNMKMFNICEDKLKKLLIIMLVSSIPCLNALGIIVSSFILYSINKKDTKLLKLMIIPFIFNILLVLGIFIICIIVDVITLKSYMDYNEITILLKNYTLFIPITIVVFIVLLFQIYIGLVFPNYIKNTFNDKKNSYTIIDEIAQCINTTESISSSPSTETEATTEIFIGN
ncbi:hypothetical protein BCR36DRAFT_413704 [Piromyces finnis]|uniref:Uncharacterized protein n=1 Tax=Piromyces finnis TaxID=1754191 RepID=A0A1Y1V5Z4_9FUNG|nr:hypothetical protein BCR36DRAFT_413704 [Piromyces finnis]|eukprot:ORX47354.1 hypothetical protein BCR36DRAFT_413704 [Piromyces finnis]